jgi:hypothetical protein
MDSCEERRSGPEFGGHYHFHHPTHRIEALINGNCFSAQENADTARRLMDQAVPYAYPCSGRRPPPSVRQDPTPTPPPTPTPTPLPGPPACPGPTVTVIYELRDPPPYAGRSTVCRDGAGKMWINVSNRIHPVTAIEAGTKDPNHPCWWDTRVVTPDRTYKGNLCRK